MPKVTLQTPSAKHSKIKRFLGRIFWDFWLFWVPPGLPKSAPKTLGELGWCSLFRSFGGVGATWAFGPLFEPILALKTLFLNLFCGTFGYSFGVAFASRSHFWLILGQKNDYFSLNFEPWDTTLCQKSPSRRLPRNTKKTNDFWDAFFVILAPKWEPKGGPLKRDSSPK